MPLDATDPRPRNPFGQFASGTSVTPDQMNRAYGIRTRVLASLLRTRPAMQNIPPLSSKDIARVTGLAAKARSVVEFARGDYAIPAMYKAKMIPYQSFHPSEYRNPMHANLVETALKRTGPKGIQLRRDRLAKVLRAQRAAPALAGLALSALAARAVELAELPGEKIRRPQFVEEDGVVKIVKTDGTAAEIGRAPGFANLLRRNKGKLVVGGLGAAAGAVLAKKLLGKSKPAA